jgi:tetratricopeptide (TPR) repeat protein
VGYHVIAILLHIGCVFLVHGIAMRLLGDHRSAVVAALVFGLHPIASEPVNYISSRSELLVAFFLLAGISAFLVRRQTGPSRESQVDSASDRKTLYLVLIAYGAALLTKATAVALPATLLVYDAIFHHRMIRRDYKLYSGMALMSGLYLWMILGQFHKATVGAPVREYGEQLWSQVKAVVLYAQLLLVPTKLSVDHQFLISDSLIDPFAAISFLLLVTIMAIGWRARGGKERIHLFLVLWFLVALAPASLVPLNVLVNEHRLYIPLAAFAIAFGWGLERMRQAFDARGSSGRWMGLTTIAGLMLSYGCMTSARNEVWGSARTLWQDAAVKAPLMARPHFFLAEDYAAAERPELAIVGYQRGLASDSTFTTGYVRLGDLYSITNDLERAERAYLKACDLEPNRGELWGYLGSHYRERAQLDEPSSSGPSNWWPRSLQAYERAVVLEPQDPALLNNLGNTYQVMGRWRDALAAHERAATVAPDDAQTLLNLGNDHQYLKDLDAARLAYERSVSAAPDYAHAWFSLGLVRQVTADTLGAIQAYTRAAQLDRQYAAAVGERLRSMRAEEGADE